MQREVLEQNPDKPLEVYAVWFNQLPGDSRGAWDASLLDDPRVTEYWDEGRFLGPWFYDNREAIGFEFFGGAVVWDASLLFGPEATWSDTPAPIEHFGYTVIARSDGLQAELNRLWSGAPASPTAGPDISTSLGDTGRHQTTLTFGIVPTERD